MGFAHLLGTEVALATFRARFDIPLDVDIKFCPEGNIENDRRPWHSCQNVNHIVN